MGAETISFKVGPHRSGTGFPLPMGSDIPKMRGSTKVSLPQLIKKLDAALEGMADTPCSFWACEGPNRPRYMITCGKCWAMREIASVRETLRRAME